jgi:hypothetical protein
VSHGTTREEQQHIETFSRANDRKRHPWVDIGISCHIYNHIISKIIFVDLVRCGMEYASFSLDVSSLQFIETALAGNVEDSEFKEYLTEIHPFLVDPLKYKVCMNGK